MRIEQYTLKLEASSTEGIHDFIQLLEETIEDIKGGSEGNARRHTSPGGTEKKVSFEINTISK